MLLSIEKIMSKQRPSFNLSRVLCIYIYLHPYLAFSTSSSAVDPLSHSLPLSLLSQTDVASYSHFRPRQILIHQGYSCVWIMSDLMTKYLFMASCLDWCSYEILFFMYHGLAGREPCWRRVDLSVPLKLWEGKGAFRPGPQKQSATWLWWNICLT